MTQRLCFACDLVDDPAAIEAYRDWHRPGGPPVGVLDRLRARGVTALEIWITGNRLFMIMELSDDAEPEPSDHSNHPEDMAWEEQMSVFQRALPWAGGQKWTPLTRMFTLPD